MSLIGRFHPLLVHFPIGLVLTAAGSELVAMLTRRRICRAIAVANVRAGALMSALTLIAGWGLASAPFVDPTRWLEWHRWTGVAAALATIVAAVASRLPHVESRRRLTVYRAALFVAAVLIGIAGHQGGVLVWGESFFRS